MLQEKLKELGFADKEVSVYLALLEIGSAVASDIAEKSGIKRSTVYVILDSLTSRGLVSVVEKRGVQLYHPAPPEQIVQYLQGMATRYAGLADTAKELLLELEASRTAQSTPAPKVQLFEGSEGIKTVELFRNKRQGKLSSKKAMEGANRWVYSSETTVR